MYPLWMTSFSTNLPYAALSPSWDRHFCFKPPMGQTFFALHPLRQMLLGCIMPHGQMFKVMKAHGTYTQPPPEHMEYVSNSPWDRQTDNFPSPPPPRYRQSLLYLPPPPPPPPPPDKQIFVFFNPRGQIRKNHS